MLEPILFLLYINNITDIIKSRNWCSVTTLADDTNDLVISNNLINLGQSDEIFRSDIK